MPLLNNPRHEKFSQLVASGIKPTEAYVSLGYSKRGAPQSANNLLKRTDVRERVNEIQSLAARSTAEEVAFDQKRVLNRLDVLSRKAEELGQISAAAKCEELIGRARGMFIDRNLAMQWDPDNLTPEQEEVLVNYLRKIAFGDDTAAADAFERKCLLEAGAQVVDIEPAAADERAHGEISDHSQRVDRIL
jgi:hypothetical protein